MVLPEPAGAVTKVSGHHRLPSAISLVIRGRLSAQSGTPGAVILAATIGMPPDTARLPARVATFRATWVAIGSPGSLPASNLMVAGSALGQNHSVCQAHRSLRRDCLAAYIRSCWSRLDASYSSEGDSRQPEALGVADGPAGSQLSRIRPLTARYAPRSRAMAAIVPEGSLLKRVSLCENEDCRAAPDPGSFTHYWPGV